MHSVVFMKNAFKPMLMPILRESELNNMMTDCGIPFTMHNQGIFERIPLPQADRPETSASFPINVKYTSKSTSAKN